MFAVYGSIGIMIVAIVLAGHFSSLAIQLAGN
jgi:hypothetical protein